MIAEIGLGLQGIKTATDLLKVLTETATKAQINEVKIGLQGALLDAQQALFAAQELQTVASNRIRDLEEEIVHLKDWESEKQRYQLQNLGNGCPAFTLKPGMENGEAPHSLCANCFQRGQKSFLVPFQIASGRAGALQCHACGSEMIVNGVDLRSTGFRPLSGR